MALTKVQKSGITNDAIDADKIEDGTVLSADIAPGTIENAKLTNSSITVNGTSVSLGGSVTAKHIDWQSVKTTDFNAVAGEGYFVDTNTVGAVTATLPGSPSAGDTIAFKDYAGTFGTNSLTIARNGNNIQGVANDSEISTNRASIVLVYIDGTKGWLYTNESNVADLEIPTFVSATGGTVTTSGDFKIHTFTGDGCFVVSSVGAKQPAASKVDYLVVAGGGAGGSYYGGGGGAGGYRTSFPSPGCNAGAFPISATTYPITVGAGGTGSPTTSPNNGPGGSNSVFSTITSAGGGGGGGGSSPSPTVPGASGGSGGGGGSQAGGTGGSGNTPPVSPPQGNNGGNANPATSSGGGGAGAAGTPSPTYTATPGGNGLTNSITGSPVAYAGGGSGNFSGGTGGSGGGGGPGATGGTNLGGGGGGDGGSGGKGVVVIRYKYQ